MPQLQDTGRGVHGTFARRGLNPYPQNRHDALRLGCPIARPAAWASKNAITADPQTIIRAVQDEVFPLNVNYFRTHTGLSAALERLDQLWQEIAEATAADESQVLPLRQA